MAGSRREMIRMSAEEISSFVEEQKSLQVACIGRDGWPHLTTLWFAVVDGPIVFGTYSRSQKIVNLRRDPRTTLLLEDGLVYEKLRGVMIKGQAELVDDPDLIQRYARAIMARNQPDLEAEHLNEVARHWSEKRTVVVVDPTEVVSWDHTKLDGVY
ncbi:MAG: pyridoxamine 5'-phosphate oxidase family protein [Actinomycetota bacterium]|nr:pyridoxamine 5'-phosphate oxidase family protein [Actinomycetota bacterium]